MSRTLLTRRLRQLEQAGLVERIGAEYLLTEAGQELEPIVFGLGEWGAKRMFGEPKPDELDAELLVWWMHERLDVSGLPVKRYVMHVRFTDDRRQYWILIEPAGPSVCTWDPGFDVDVTLTADVSSLYQLWLGRLPIRDAVNSGRVRVDGVPAIVRRMPTVMRLSPVHDVVAAHR